MRIRLAALVALATLPGLTPAALPPPGEDAKASAAVAKAKADWSAKVAAYQLCLSQDRVADHYLKQSGGRKPDAGTPPCVNPGPFNPPDAAAQAGDMPKAQ